MTRVWKLLTGQLFYITKTQKSFHLTFPPGWLYDFNKVTNVVLKREFMSSNLGVCQSNYNGLIILNFAEHYDKKLNLVSQLKQAISIDNLQPLKFLNFASSFVILLQFIWKIPPLHLFPIFSIYNQQFCNPLIVQCHMPSDDPWKSHPQTLESRTQIPILSSILIVRVCCNKNKTKSWQRQKHDRTTRLYNNYVINFSLWFRNTFYQ